MGHLGETGAHGLGAGAGVVRTAAGKLGRCSLLALACAATALTGCQKNALQTDDGSERKPQRPQTLGLPAKGAYTGAFIDFGDTEDDVTLEKIEGFEKLVGKRQAIIASSSYWGEQTFPAVNVRVIARHGSVPLVFWSPWDKPYEEYNEGEQTDRDAFAGANRFSLTSILAGKWDGYIDQWADGAREFGQPLMVSFANEMNGTWFPWSGSFYGAEKPLPKNDPREPDHFAGPETFKKAYRHIVDRVRARGAQNILWVFHVMNYSYPQDVWNLAAQYYPGADYVDWLGVSVYGKQYAEETWTPFFPVFDWPFQELTRIDPVKPIMVAEWGVGEYPDAGNKAAFIAEAFATMKMQPRLKAAVFWHERWQNEDDTYSNLRVNSSPEALKAYREGVADPFWVSDPVFTPARR